MLRERATAYPGMMASETGQNELKEATVSGQAERMAEEQADLSDLVRLRRAKQAKHVNCS